VVGSSTDAPVVVVSGALVLYVTAGFLVVAAYLVVGTVTEATVVVAYLVVGTVTEAMVVVVGLYPEVVLTAGYLGGGGGLVYPWAT